MKTFSALSLAILLITSCNTDPRKKLEPTGLFGQSVETDNARTVADVMPLIQQDSPVNITVTGTIKEYCTGEGCWLTLDNPTGTPLFVEVENHAFILPYNINGKTAVVTGKTGTTTNPQGAKEPMISATGILIK